MGRAVREIVDPSPRSVEPLWNYFDDCCAYCGKKLTRSSRDGHVDHATSDGGNHLGNLLLSSGTCNGDEKRELGWREFLQTKAPGSEYKERQARILAWFRLHDRDPPGLSSDALKVKGELDRLIEKFGDTCGELKKLVGNDVSEREL